jgi:hypothetical protein
MGALGSDSCGGGMCADVWYLISPPCMTTVVQIAWLQRAATVTAGTMFIGPGSWSDTWNAARTVSPTVCGAKEQISAWSDHTLKPTKRLGWLCTGAGAVIGGVAAELGEERGRKYDCGGKREDPVSLATGVVWYDEDGMRSGARTMPRSE